MSITQELANILAGVDRPGDYSSPVARISWRHGSRLMALAPSRCLCYRRKQNS